MPDFSPAVDLVYAWALPPLLSSGESIHLLFVDRLTHILVLNRTEKLTFTSVEQVRPTAVPARDVGV